MNEKYKCGECGKEIDGNGNTVHKKGKPLMRYCDECYKKPEVTERIRKM